MQDTLSNGVNFRTLNVIDDHNREGLLMVMDTSLNSRRVTKELDQLIAWRGAPQKIRVDNGPEFIAEKMKVWSEKRGIEIKFIEKGKPYQNGFMERYNRSFREEVLDAYCFNRVQEAMVMGHAWMWMYNNQRPHSSLGYKPPVRFLNERCVGLEAFPTFIQNQDCNWESLVLTATN